MKQICTLLQFSDPHLFAAADGELRGVITLRSLQATVDAALSRHPDPDAILVTGDIAQDESREAYARLRDCLDGAGAPVYCLPGNHDNPVFMREALDHAPFRYCGHIAADKWIVPMLSSHDPGEATGRLAGGELERLRTLLEAHRDRHALIALHHHPLPTGSAWLDTVPLTNPGALFQILDDHPQVRAVVWGHVHQAMAAWRGDVLMLATPSTCNQFRPRSTTFALDDKPPAYRWLHLHDNGTIATAVQWCETARALA